MTFGRLTWRTARAMAIAVLLGMTSAMPVLGAMPGEGPVNPEPSCREPHPCEYRWDGGEGPFDRLPVEDVAVAAHDGVLLDGWLVRPDLPDGVRAPVVLHSSPYYGQAIPTGDHDLDHQTWSSPPVDRLVSEGYAVAMFSVRGTGNSGGCFDFFGSNEQQDQATLVEWLAAQPWSNGRVGMAGLSYQGTTPVEAAIQNPPALKTIIIAGTVLDAYGFLHTPQGARTITGEKFGPYYWGYVSGGPPAQGHAEALAGHVLEYLDEGEEIPVQDYATSVAGYTAEHVGPGTERWCEDVATLLTAPTEESLSDVRAPQFWAERRMIDRVPDITAATWVVHGFNDRLGSGHAFQDDWAWDALQSAPKRMLLGQWAHILPYAETLPGGASFEDEMVAWFDYWLKGIGDRAPGLGLVDYADDAGVWHQSSSWPPAAARDEVLYLDGHALTPVPPAVASTAAFDPSATGPLTDSGTDDDVCLPDVPGATPSRLVYATAPVAERTVVAGNPMAWLRLSSDRDGGLVGVDVFRQASDGTCEGVRLTEGAADLRFHDDTDYRGTHIPVDTPVSVRIDIANQAVVLNAGDRLVAVLGQPVVQAGSPTQTDGPLSPTLTVHHGGPDASQIAVSVIEGGFGGSPPTSAYPPRPFAPTQPETDAP